MLKIGISQAQAQFRKLLTQTVFIVDKKAHQKKVVTLPYDEYEKLIKQATSKESLKDGGFNKSIGILDNSLATDDIKYKEIIK